MINASQKDNVLDFNLQEALNDLIQEGIRDPNVLLKYSQNPPPKYGDNGSLLVSLAANAVARSKQAVKTLQPSPNTTIAEQVQTKLASAAQPQGIAGLAPQAPTAPQGINTPPPPQNMDGGIAPLPIDDTMYSNQNYAGGGIVSFDNGGNVQHFVGGGNSFVNPLSSLPNAYTDPQDIRGTVIRGYKQALPDILEKKGRGLPITETEQLIMDTLYQSGDYNTPMFDLAPSKNFISPEALKPKALSLSNTNNKEDPIKEAPPAETQTVAKPVKEKPAAPSSPGIGGLNTANTQPKTLTAMIDDRKKLLESQGVDTSYFDKQLTELRKEKEEDLTSSQRMMQSNILFSLAKSLGETPGGLMRGLVRGGIDAGPVVDAAMKEQKEIKKLSKKEERATIALQRAEKRGDVDAIEKAKSNRETIEAELQGKHITGGYGIQAANIAAAAKATDKTVANREKIAHDIRERIKQTHAQGDLTDEQYNTLFNKMYYDALKLNSLLPEGTVVPASSSGKGKTDFSTGVYHP